MGPAGTVPTGGSKAAGTDSGEGNAVPARTGPPTSFLKTKGHALACPLVLSDFARPNSGFVSRRNSGLLGPFSPGIARPDSLWAGESVEAFTLGEWLELGRVNALLSGEIGSNAGNKIPVMRTNALSRERIVA